MSFLHSRQKDKVRVSISQLKANEHASCHLQHDEGHHAEPQNGMDKYKYSVSSGECVQSVGNEQEEDVDVCDDQDGPPHQWMHKQG